MKASASKNQKKANKISGATLIKYRRLKNILRKMGKALVAYSGGVDSTFLLKAAHDVLKESVLAVIASSKTYPEQEIKEAARLARKLNIHHRIIHTSELENPDFIANSPQRCYFCKRELFSKLRKIAKAKRIPYILDGSNYDDRLDFRPGARAAREFGIRSPLKEARLGKQEIRQLSRRFGLPTWRKPSLACLASRFPYYSEIDTKSLKQVARAENYLRSVGFSQIRVRHHGLTARIEIGPDEFPRIIEKKLRETIIRNLKKFGYTYITLDLAGYRTGSMNEPLKVISRRL
jgi:uncharacterized protein